LWPEAQQAVDPAAWRAQLPAKAALPGDYKRVEHNRHWNACSYDAAAAAGAAAISGRAAAVQGLPLPQHAATAELGVLMLSHGKGAPGAALWEQWEAAHGGKVVVLVHLKQSVKLSKVLPGGEWISQRLLRTRVDSQWGDVSLTAAIMTAAADMLSCCPSLRHLAVVSGQDVPVAAVQLPLPAGVSLFGRFQFGAVYDAAASQVAAALLQHELDMEAAEAAAWGDALTFHHTWMVLSR
jgi:hypothetical protein